MEISAEYKPSPRESLLLEDVKAKKSAKFCPKCTLGLDIKHTDVLILSQFLRSDGTMLPRRVTGLCNTQQKNIGTMVLMARKAGKFSNDASNQDLELIFFFFFRIGLLALKAQLESKKPNKCFGYKGLNHYFDEKTIRYGRRPINVD